MADRPAVLIVSDTSDTESEDDLYILRHSRDIQSRDYTFNVHPIAIGGSRASPSQPKENGRPLQSDVNSNQLESYGSTTRPGVQTEVANNVVHFSDLEINNSEQEGISYRQESVSDADSKAFSDKKKNAIWNLVLLGSVVFFANTAFVFYFMDALLLNVADADTQRAAYVVLLVMTLASMVAAWPVINMIGAKWTLFVGCMGISAFTTARFFASMGFMIPAAIVCGATNGPFIVSIVTYMLHLVRDYSSRSGKDEQDVFYYFNAFISSCTLFAPFFAALLRLMFLSLEVSRTFQDAVQTPCMKNFCWTKAFGLAIYEQKEFSGRAAADDFLVQALLGCLLVCSLGAAFLTWLRITDEGLTLTSTDQDLDDYKNCCRCPKPTWDSSWLVEPMKRFCDANMLLLAPLGVYFGAQQYFMYSVYLQAFSQCSSQLFHAIMMAISLSLVSGGISLTLPPIIVLAGRVKMLIPAMVAQLVLLVVMVTMADMGLPALYVITAFWAVCDAILHNVIPAACVAVFHETTEPALVCVKMCQVTGYLLVTTLQLGHACNYVIITFLMVVLVLAGVCYVSMVIKLGVERRETRTRGGQYVPLLRDPAWLPDINPVEVRRERTSSLSSRVPEVH